MALKDRAHVKSRQEYLNKKTKWKKWKEVFIGLLEDPTNPVCLEGADQVSHQTPRKELLGKDQNMKPRRHTLLTAIRCCSMTGKYKEVGNELTGGHCSGRTINMWLGYSHWALCKPLRDSYPQPHKLLFFLSSLEPWEVTEATEPVLLWSDLIWPVLLGFHGKKRKTLKTHGSGEQGRGGGAVLHCLI